MLEYAAAVLAGGTMLAVFVPLMPDLPGNFPIGNDGSWRFALNQAVAQGLVLPAERSPFTHRLLALSKALHCCTVYGVSGLAKIASKPWMRVCPAV